MGISVNVGGSQRTVSNPACNIGGVWHNISKIMCNVAGVWRQAWQKMFAIYTNGVANYSSWSKTLARTSYGNQTFTKYATYMFMQTESASSYTYEVVALAATIDVTNYTKLCVDWDSPAIPGNAVQGWMEIYVAAANNVEVASALASLTVPVTGSRVRTTDTLDISGVTGNVYMLLENRTPSGGDGSYMLSMDIYNIWLE